MADVLVKRIFSADKLNRVSIFRRTDGFFYYADDDYRVYTGDDDYGLYDQVTVVWWDGQPSGIYATAHQAEADARSVLKWLGQSISPQ